MAGPTTDWDLLRDFTESNSETAFQSLVERHVNLVFATAFRRLGDAARAEEVTQDVFIALARKAARFHSEVSLSGWLYKTALLHARQTWRGEFRRERREQTAVELKTTMKDDDSALKSLAGALDEGLMELRQDERQVLLLRFIEGHTFKEIGASFGIAEDAARKRVDNALDQLGEFFRKRGYAVGSTTTAAAVLAAATLSAPAGLAPAVAQVAFAHAAVSGLPLLSWLGKLLRPSKAQTAVFCAGLILGPGLWQGARLVSAKGEQRRMEALLAALQTERKFVARDQTEIARQLRRSSNALAQLQVLSAYGSLLKDAQLDPRLFRWEESADYVRVPKATLRWITSENGDGEQGTIDSRSGRVSATLLGLLGLSAEEQAGVQQFCKNQIEAYRDLAESMSYFTNFPDRDPKTPSFVALTEDSRGWVTPALSSEESSALRTRFEGGLTQLLGAERTAILLRNAGDDDSLSRCFQQFGAEDLVIALTPRPEGGCSVGERDHSPDGKDRWNWSAKVSFTTALNPATQGPPDISVPGSLPAGISIWSVLSQPIPVPLLDYLRQWRDAHPEVPDEPPKP